jgi:shikimate dehydrogenase
MGKLFGLIGCPVSHSMSPLMHNDMFQRLGIDAYYHAFHVEKEHLKDAVQGIKALGIAGFNVTIPHKTAIIPFLDDIDEVASQIGAVNTVVNENGRLVGYNTDGPGFVRALSEELNIELEGKSILLIGAGGAARGIYFSLALSGAACIDLCNRTIEKAEQLISEQTLPVLSSAYSIEDAAQILEKYDIIINTTSVGMHPNINETPICLKNLKKGAAVSDIIYNPLKTLFLKEAERRGALIQNGVGMFVYQGALAFEKWTGRFPNISRMKQIVIQQLGGE